MINSVASNNFVRVSGINRGGGSDISINNFPPNTPTAGLSPYTDEEIKEKLWDLARREVAAGNYAWSTTSARYCGNENNEEFRRLMTYFQSNISPDRVGVVNSQLNSMSQGLNLPSLRHNQSMQIFDMLIRALGQSGRNPNVGVNFIHFMDPNGSGLPIAMYIQGGGLTAGLREEELQLGGEFSMLFKEMKTQIKSQEGNTDSLIDMKRSGIDVDLSLWANKGQAFNMDRLAANGITFDSATGQTNVDQTLLRKAISRYEANINYKTVTMSDDTVSISAEARAMFSTQPSTSNEERAAAGLRTREMPLITEREFTVFSRNVLADHMEDADKHLGLMKRAIRDPNRFFDADLSLEERTIKRENVLQEAQRLADKFLSGEEAQRFIEGFENLIREAEMVERGYIRDGILGDIIRNPLSQADTHSLNRFVESNMTDDQREEFNLLSNEVNRLSSLSQAIATHNSNEMTFQEAIDAFEIATAKLRAFVESMGEYHDFQEQWNLWQSGDQNNWFAQATTAFEENSASIAAQIQAIQQNYT